MHSIFNSRDPNWAYRALWQTAAVYASLLLLAGAVAYLPIMYVAATIVVATGALIFLRWPWIIWPIIGAVLPFSSSFKRGPVSITELLFAAAIGLWFIDGVRRRRLHLRDTPLVAPLVLYISVLLFAAWGAADLEEAAAEVVKWLQILAIIFIIQEMIPRRHTRWLVWALLAGGIGQALFGLYQFIFHVGPVWFVIFGRFMRASGSFAQPNPYAGYLGLTLPVAVSLLLWTFARYRQRASFTRRELRSTIIAILCYGGTVGLISMALLASWSRGGWLGSATGVAFVMLLHNRRSIVLSVSGALVVMIMLLLNTLGLKFIPGPIAARIADIPQYFGLINILDQQLTAENFAVMERMAHWVAAIRMWEIAPWLGVGPGNYEVVYPAVRLPFWKEPLGHAHNIYLNILGESGLFGLLVYLLLWSAIFTWLWRLIGRMQHATPLNAPRGGTVRNTLAGSSPTWNSALAIGVFGVIVHLSVHNFFDNLYVQGMYMHIGLWLATLHILNRESQDFGHTEMVELVQ